MVIDVLVPAQTAGLNLIPAFLDNNINEVGKFL